MNTNDAEIAGKLDGMECRGATLTKSTSLNDVWLTFRQRDSFIVLGPSDLLTFCREVVDKVDGPAKPTDIERIIYALRLWMKRIVMGVPAHSQEGWEVRWERLEKVITDWKTKGEMPK